MYMKVEVLCVILHEGSHKSAHRRTDSALEHVREMGWSWFTWSVFSLVLFFGHLRCQSCLSTLKLFIGTSERTACPCTHRASKAPSKRPKGWATVPLRARWGRRYWQWSLAYACAKVAISGSVDKYRNRHVDMGTRGHSRRSNACIFWEWF